MEIKTRIQNKRDSEENWISLNPVLLNGEIALIDQGGTIPRIKIGDGINNYSNLPFLDNGNYIPTGMIMIWGGSLKGGPLVGIYAMKLMELLI